MEQIGWVSTQKGSGDGPSQLPRTYGTTPQSARMYDYYLGGKDHYEVDREAAEKALDVAPALRTAAYANRHFLHVAVEHLAREHGITQFLDIGTGIPTQPNTHQVAQWHQPTARVLYTDYDPIVLAHARALMTSTDQGRVDYIMADLMEPDQILMHPCLSGDEPVLDMDQPIAVFMIAILHFVPDPYGPTEILRRLMEPMASGSFLAVTHVTPDWDEGMEDAARVYRKNGVPTQVRSKQEIAELMEEQDLEVLMPGIQPVNRWWPSRPANLAPFPLYSNAQASAYGLLARKP